MSRNEIIQTARLRLRKPEVTDAQAIFNRYASDPEVTRYLSWPTHLSLAETVAFLTWSDADWAQWPAGSYLVFSRNGDRLLGGTGSPSPGPLPLSRVTCSPGTLGAKAMQLNRCRPWSK